MAVTAFHYEDVQQTV